MDSKTDKPTDFEIELGRIDDEISELRDTAFSPPFDSERATRFAYRLYQRGSLTGDFAELEVAEAAINRAVAHVGNAADLYFLKANLDFKFHRLADVKRNLEMDAGLRDSLQARALRADLDFQEGRYEDARYAYEAVIRDDRTWDNLARLAYFKFKMNDREGAEELYVEAVDELTAKEMRHYSWVELQRGVLDLTSGRYEDAEAHYRRAERAYSGHWQTAEHLAELLAARGELEEAAALYRKVVARVPRPELQQALGELYALMGEHERAEGCYERALTAYLDSARRGGVHYYHHLVDFFADVREDRAEAVRWARKDLELRDNFSTQAALAWALYRDDQSKEARDLVNSALASGASDAHLFHQAGMIHLAAGSVDEGNKYLQAAAEINPHHRNFHVHR